MINLIRLSFRTDEGKVASITIPKAKTPVVPADVNTLMDGLCNPAVFQILSTSRGNLTTKEKAELIARDTFEFKYA